MRNLFKMVALGAAVSFALQGCSLFSSEEDLNPMAPLPKVESAFTADTAWSSTVGDGIGDSTPSSSRWWKRIASTRRPATAMSAL